MKPTLEKLMYLTLLLLFMGGVVMFVVLFSQNRKMNQELDALKVIQANQSKAVTQLNGSVDTLKADNQSRTNLIICMLQVPVAQRTTDVERACRAASTPIATAAPSSTPAPTAAPSSSRSTTPSSPSSSPTPSPPSTPCPVKVLFVCL